MFFILLISKKLIMKDLVNKIEGKFKFPLLFSFFFFSLMILACSSSDDPKKEPTPDPPQVEYAKKEGDIRILSYNVRHFENDNKQLEYNNIAKIIKSLNADVVCLQEVDNKTKRSKGVDQIKEIATLTGMHSAFSKSIDSQDGEYGNGMLSKEKAIETKQFALPGNEARSVLLSVFKDYVVLSTHLSLEDYNRVQSIKTISEIVKEYEDKAVFLAGDLNEGNLSSPFFNEVKKNWSIDSASKNTYPSPNPTKRIDFILSYTTNKIKTQVTQSDVVYGLKEAKVPSASDHFPLFCDYKITK